MARSVDAAAGASSQRSRGQLSRRLRRIEGQVRGVEAMIAEDRDLTEVVTQLRAVQSATAAAIEFIERERLVEQVKATIERAVRECIGHCDLCDQLAQLISVLDRLDSSTLAEPG